MLESLHLPVVTATRLETFLQADGDETRLLVRLHLRQPVQVGADHRAQRGISPTGHRIAMQDDGFEPARYLDRADGIAGVDDVGRVRACAEWLFARLEPSAVPPLKR